MNILLIDDDDDLCQELSEILTDEGYAVETAKDGAQGMRLLKENSYDLILLDYRMPTSDGVKVLQFVKDRGVKARVFVTSGRPFIEKLIREAGLADYVTSFVNKPLMIDDLLGKIKNI